MARESEFIKFTTLEKKVFEIMKAGESLGITPNHVARQLSVPRDTVINSYNRACGKVRFAALVKNVTGNEIEL